MLEMTDKEKFLFDLQGYLVIPDFLTRDEVDRLNQAIDANADKVGEDGNIRLGDSSALQGPLKRQMLRNVLTMDHPWCDPFRDLLVHPKVVPYLNTLLGPGWRLDHAPVIFMAEDGAEGLMFHGATSRTPNHVECYSYANGQMHCGMIALEFNLTDQGGEDGGWAAIPGSHKSNLQAPDEILHWDDHQEIFQSPRCQAGSLVIFNEATIHGTLPWTGKHERRAALYRYSPRYIHFSGGYYDPTFPDWVDELSEAQRAVLEPPHIYNRPYIEDDGRTVTVRRR